jgi:heat shock protein HslJ
MWAPSPPTPPFLKMCQAVGTHQLVLAAGPHRQSTLIRGRMSRRHTPFESSRLASIAAIVSLSLLAGTLVAPSGALAQGASGSAGDLLGLWQPITYQVSAGPARPKTDSVPPEAGVYINLFGDLAQGQAACSDFRWSFGRYASGELFFQEPEIEWLECEQSLRDFDETFYRLLEKTSNFHFVVSEPSKARAQGGRAVPPSMVEFRDPTQAVLLTLTKADVGDDPTIARWELTRVAATDGSVAPIVAGVDSWIEFLRGGRLVGDTGCGSLLGSYTTASGTMAITDLAYRLLDSCPDPARSQAQSMVDALADISAYEILPAGITLQDAALTTRLAFKPKLELGDRYWTPVSLYRDGQLANVTEQRLSTSAVRFTGNQVDGRTICGPFSASLIRSGLALKVTDPDLPSPRSKNCPDGKPTMNGRIENAFLDALDQAASHALHGDALELKDVDDNTLALLRPQANLVGPTWQVTKVLPDTTITATFDDLTSTMKGLTGAGSNTYLATYRVDNGLSMGISGMKAFGRACKGKRAGTPACKQQDRFLTKLRQVDNYSVRDQDLTLRDKDGNTIIKLAPQTGDTGTAG